VECLRCCVGGGWPASEHEALVPQAAACHLFQPVSQVKLGGQLFPLFAVSTKASGRILLRFCLIKDVPRRVQRCTTKMQNAGCERHASPPFRKHLELSIDDRYPLR
jgi:hypothetical protein